MCQRCPDNNLSTLSWYLTVYLLCHRDAFRAVGGFSTALFALEEIDFVIRLERHGRKLGRRFAVLHRHPVVTSGRKGELNPVSLLRLAVANTAAVVLLALSFVLPERLMPKAPSALLGYWYRRR